MPQENTSEAMFTKYFQTGILVIGAFIIGYLFSQVQYLKSNGSTGTKPTTQVVADDEPQVGESVTLASIVQAAGADADNVQSCLDNGEFTSDVSAETSAGGQAGVNGTPGNFIVVDGNQGEILAGAVPFEQLKPILDQYVSAGKTANTTDLGSLPAVDGEDHVRGSQDAKVTIVEYSDFDCPFCSRFHTTMQQVLDEYDGQVNWVYRHFPLPQLHPNAQKIAEASECIASQNGEEAFWNFADAYYEVKTEGKTVTL